MKVAERAHVIRFLRRVFGSALCSHRSRIVMSGRPKTNRLESSLGIVALLA